LLLTGCCISSIQSWFWSAAQRRSRKSHATYPRTKLLLTVLW
jgi:hypothetical protein